LEVHFYLFGSAGCLRRLGDGAGRLDEGPNRESVVSYGSGFFAVGGFGGFDGGGDSTGGSELEKTQQRLWERAE